MGFDAIQYACRTDVGVRRSHNQDSFAALPAKDPVQFAARGHVFMVADGMGAHAVGELASKLAADGVTHLYSKYAREGAMPALRRAFIETNANIYTRGQQNKEFEGMGTTGTALLLRPEGAWIGHVGDSRAYRIRRGKIEQLSFDHSLVWELAKRQGKNPDDMKDVPSNVIVRSLGPEGTVQVDVEGPHPIEFGDIYVLCSDGLSGQVTDREIGAVASALPPEEAGRFLIHLANLHGGPDNITTVVVRVSGGSDSWQDGPAPGAATHVPRDWNKFVRAHGPLLLMLLGIGLAGLAILFTLNQWPGELPVFVLAAVSLLGGLVSLLVQQKQRINPAEEPGPRRLNIHRSASCAVDEGMVQRIAQAATVLQERIRERQWAVDVNRCRSHMQQGQDLLEAGELSEAFAAHCQAMLILMDAIDQHRHKEETFKPLWDQAGVK